MVFPAWLISALIIKDGEISGDTKIDSSSDKFPKALVSVESVRSFLYTLRIVGHDKHSILKLEMCCFYLKC
jgi:hypothetical protein